MIDSYPLAWPPGWPRAEYKEWSKFKISSIGRAIEGLMTELNRLGATDVVISSNLRRRLDGLPYSDQRAPEDPGVAVYFKLDGNDQCIPCDKWQHVEDNIHAIAKTIDALRGIERWGAKEMVNAAFSGFKALPAQAGAVVIGDAPWYSVLGVEPNASREEIKKAYQQLARVMHPDGGGSSEEFGRLTRAYQQGMSQWQG